MKNKNGLLGHRYFTASFTASLFTGIFLLPIAMAEDVVSELPIYKTEEIAAPDLAERIKKTAEKTGVAIVKSMPLPPDSVRKTIRIGAKLQAQGTAEQVTKFLSAVGSQAEFHNLSALSIAADRKDPDLLITECVLNAWYAKNEKASRKTDKWKRSLAPNPSALEIYATCSAGADGERVRFTSFSLELETVSFAGEAHNSSDANRFGGKLFQNDKLSAYQWVWEMRPKYNTKRKDGTVQFKILGKLKAAPKKEGKRKKE